MPERADNDGPWTHVLKCWPVYFDAIVRGEKTFELRRDDRPFRFGDCLELHEWSPLVGFTGRRVVADVTYILRGEDARAWLQPGMCAIGIARVAVTAGEE